MMSVETQDYASVASAAVAVGRDLSAPLPPLDVQRRVAALQQMVGRSSTVPGDGGCDAVLITDLLNIRYLTGFTGSAARLLVTPRSVVFVSDARYAERAASELRSAGCEADIVIERTVGAQNDRIDAVLQSEAVARLGLEAGHVTWQQADEYRARYSERGTTLVPTNDLVENLRRRKDPAEIARLARASAIADAALAEVSPLLWGALTEVQFARALEDAMAQRGSQGPSFATIVASGPNASRPHHEPDSRVISPGDEVIIDFGATVDGYHSDMTRTRFAGRPPSDAQRARFELVHRAQRAGIAAVLPGAEGVAVDRATRSVIDEAGLGAFYVHGTGHGSGLLIHEAPWLGPTSTSVLAEGDIVTVEPGVYLPGSGGVRIEDSMVVTAAGPLLLTAAPYGSGSEA